MLPACATVINVNIRVWENDGGFINELQFDVHPNPSQHTIHLLYSHTLNADGIPDPTLDLNNLCHHYDALILKPSSEDEGSIRSFSSDKEYSQKSQESTINTDIRIKVAYNTQDHYVPLCKENVQIYTFSRKMYIFNQYLY